MLFRLVLLLLLLRESGDDALAFLFDVLCETGMALLHEAGRETELEKGDGENRSEVVEIGTRFRELHRFYRFIEELLHCVVQLAFEQLGLGHRR